MSVTLRYVRHAMGVLTAVALLSGHALAEGKSKAPTAAAPSEGAPAVAGVVNINTANASELGRLPGIGPAKADAIIALRTRIKRFTRVEQLMRVRGIGRKTFLKLRPMLTINGPTTLGSASAPEAAPKAVAKARKR